MGLECQSFQDDEGLRWTPFFGQDCAKLSYGDHGLEW